MPLACLPTEIISQILSLAACANQVNGERFTYGLTQTSLPIPSSNRSAPPQKYLRGPVTAEALRWDATSGIRQVCAAWHEWALSYNLEHVFERCWRGSERWANLSNNRRKMSLYELIDKPSTQAVYRDPYASLKKTNAVFAALPELTGHVRRLWFNGFHAAETDRLILSIVAECQQLNFLSVPWTVLRRGSVEDWIDLLNVNTGHGVALQSLELQAVCLPKDQADALDRPDTCPDPLADPRVDFGSLKRLKIFGNTLHRPICDRDLELIARTATNLEVLDITNLNTISVAGMLALVKASRATLQVLEHSPRSDDGFFHPFPGNLPTDEHVCKLLTSLPRMKDLSVSLPYMCHGLFANQEVQWQGECQVRAIDLCGCNLDTAPLVRARQLRELLSAARKLVAARRRVHHQLSIELFFAGCIFEPEKNLVHGDFVLAEIRSDAQWPRARATSTKGPYGTTGVYGKADDHNNWDAVWEDEYLCAVEHGWVQL